MKVLVTGANGQLGQEFQALQDAHPALQFVFVSKERLDIADAEAVEKTFSEIQPDYCINCAAYTAVDKAEGDEAMAHRINADGTKYLAEICHKQAVRFIHISTDYVFNGDGEKPYVEDESTSPIGVYGASKLDGEKFVQQVNNNAVIIRTSWVFSAFGNNFVKTMLRLMPVKEALNVVSDQQGCPTYAADLATAIAAIINSGKWEPGIFHFSNSNCTTWFEFATAIKEHCRFACTVHPITTDQYPTPARRPKYSVLNTQKIQSVYNLSIRDWKPALAECLQKLNCTA
jgi:dTDP-4-dehydrorhamnose reductase